MSLRTLPQDTIERADCPFAHCSVLGRSAIRSELRSFRLLSHSRLPSFGTSCVTAYILYIPTQPSIGQTAGPASDKSAAAVPYLPLPYIPDLATRCCSRDQRPEAVPPYYSCSHTTPLTHSFYPTPPEAKAPEKKKKRKITKKKTHPRQISSDLPPNLSAYCCYYIRPPWRSHKYFTYQIRPALPNDTPLI